MHLTATYSQRIVKEYYRKKPAYSYWFGCSSGGKQGLKELQVYPDTFDGVIAGGESYAGAIFGGNLPVFRRFR